MAPNNKKKAKKAKPAKVRPAKPTKVKLGKGKLARAAKPVKASTTARATPVPKTLAARVLRPLDDRLLVEPEGASDKTAGGIIIPGTAQQRPYRGKVLAKGPGKRNKKGQIRPLDVGVGDLVLYPEFAGTQVTLDGADFVLLREEEVLGITE